MNKLIIYTDGGARGNPGPAAIGVAVYEAGKPNNPVKTLSKVIGHTTNNQAEYHALLAGLQLAEQLRAEEVVCYLDSELVVKQLNGQYKVKDAGLKEIVPQIFKAQNQFRKIEFKHVPREKNKLADQLVNEALDKAGH